MNSKEFLNKNLPNWGKLLLARDQFESEIAEHIASALEDMSGSIRVLGIDLGNIEPEKRKRDSDCFYYRCTARVKSIKGLSIHETERLVLTCGYVWLRQPESEADLLPFSFCQFEFREAKNPKTWKAFFSDIGSKIKQRVDIESSKHHAYFVFKDDQYCRNNIDDLDRDIQELLRTISSAL